MTGETADGNDNASVLVMAGRRALAAPVLDHFAAESMTFGFMRPPELAYAGPRLLRMYRLVVVLDLDGDIELRDTAAVLATQLPCVIVSDMDEPAVHDFRAILHTDTSPTQLLATLRNVVLLDTDDELVGDSAAMQQVRQLIERVAVTRTPVLITGESGTGKERVAREIHRRSGRRGVFVVLDCGAISRDLLEFELFGREGAGVVGADEGGAGRLAQARGGTLFLDGVDDMTPDLQARLVRALNERVLAAAGSASGAGTDVRIISAAQGDLAAAIQQGRFRDDLYYRLAVFPIRVPPLRQRAVDIASLMASLGRRIPGPAPYFDSVAMSRLKSHDWPGNVRELANLLERLTILYPGESIDWKRLDAQLSMNRPTAPAPAAAVDSPASRPAPSSAAPSSIPAEQIEALRLPEDGVDLRELVETLEKRLIAQALEQQAGVVAHAARALGLRRTTLIEKLRRYAISND
ncbi:sigma 54-interacting transcriptional regulator [Salinisphaera aquimarina]|uniref:Sigma 54-interacting transcriptional regulator n=1 Tax=Salinisphaera aquimarina TaxID=2094031 RepID=A0ABV7ERB5_9GAMM